MKPPTTRIATRDVDKDVEADVAKHPSKAVEGGCLRKPCDGGHLS